VYERNFLACAAALQRDLCAIAPKKARMSCFSLELEEGGFCMRTRIVILALGVGLVASTEAMAQAAIRVTPADCRRVLTEHRPAPDVAYQPGVDVRGRPVVGADLNPAPQFKVPDNVVFDLAIDLTKYGISSTSPLSQPNFKMGEMRMDMLSGRAFYNGQPLGNPELEALREACRAQGLAKP
jgi:hypothetical protein